MSGEAPAEFALIDEFGQPAPSDSPAGPADTSRLEAPADRATFASSEPTRRCEPDLQSVLQLDMPHVEASPSRLGGSRGRSCNPATCEASVSPASRPTPDRQAPSWLDEPSPSARRHPLRFMWQMDAEGRFSLGSDEFTRLIGAHTAAGFGRPWSEIAETFGLDPDGRVARAVATGSTWSGITLDWPVDGGDRLPVELSGLPIYDHTGKLAGYRGFGVCRDLDGLTRLAALRRHEFFSPPPAPQAPVGRHRPTRIPPRFARRGPARRLRCCIVQYA